MAPRIVTCYADGRDSKWEAFCLDFDLAVQGSSFSDVQAKLHEQIAVYLETVAALPVGERAHFLNRKVPLLTRLQFLWQVVRAQAGSILRSGKNNRMTFPVESNIVVA